MRRLESIKIGLLVLAIALAMVTEDIGTDPVARDMPPKVKAGYLHVAPGQAAG